MAKSDFDLLYKEFVSKAKMANKNIKKIEQEFGGDSWAVKKLKDRLENPKYNGWTRGNRISIAKPKSMEELRARLSAVDKFNQSKTHTVRGIKSVSKRIKETIKEKLGKNEIDITNDEVEALYQAFEDEDVSYLSEKIGKSEFWIETSQAREHKDKYDDFIKRLGHYIEIDGSDDEINEKLERIYNKYINK